MTTDVDEFAFLSEQVRKQDPSITLPPMRRETFAGSDGRTVSGIRVGTGAPEITMLHGAGLNAHTWDATLIALDKPVLALDLPGHGDSTWRDDADYSPAAMGPDVADVIAAATDRPQVLVGHSLGGITAAWIAAHRPELVRALVLVDITPGIDPSAGPAALRAFYGVADFASRDEAVDHAMSFGLGGSRASAERGVFFNTRVRPDGRVEWKHHFAKLAREHSDDQQTKNVLGESGWSDLAAVRAPITLVRGTDGFIGDPALAEFRERLPGARVIELPATHNVQETAPAELAAIIDAATT